MPTAYTADRTVEISVIIPTYNRAELLKRAVGSIFRQTRQDFELIVVDDAATDDTPAVMRGIDDCRLMYIRHDHNRGVGAAYNTGISAAQGSLIAILDHDDVARPTWLERLSTACLATPDIGMTWSWIRSHGRGARPTAIMYRDPFASQHRELLPTMLIWTPGTSGLMVRREVFDTIGVMDPEAGPLADLDFTARFARSGKFRLDIVPEVLVEKHPQSDSASGRVDERFLGALQHFIDEHETTLVDHPCAHAHYMYRLGRTAELLGQTDVDELYAKAVEYCPSSLKYRLYPLARDLHVMRAWRILSSLRVASRRWFRRIRHARTA